jgi:hypothetical protein
LTRKLPRGSFLVNYIVAHLNATSVRCRELEVSHSLRRIARRHRLEHCQPEAFDALGEDIDRNPLMPERPVGYHRLTITASQREAPLAASPVTSIEL